MLQQKKSHDTFRIDPSKLDPQKRRLIRSRPDHSKRQCWELTLPEILELWKAAGRHIDSKLKKEYLENEIYPWEESTP